MRRRSEGGTEDSTGSIETILSMVEDMECFGPELGPEPFVDFPFV
jgi:hypothetical protein